MLECKRLYIHPNNHTFNCLVIEMVRTSPSKKIHIDHVCRQLSMINKLYFYMPVWELRLNVKLLAESKHSLVYLENNVCHFKTDAFSKGLEDDCIPMNELQRVGSPTIMYNEVTGDTQFLESISKTENSYQSLASRKAYYPAEVDVPNNMTVAPPITLASRKAYFPLVLNNLTPKFKDYVGHVKRRKNVKPRALRRMTRSVSTDDESTRNAIVNVRNNPYSLRKSTEYSSNTSQSEDLNDEPIALRKQTRSVATDEEILSDAATKMVTSLRNDLDSDNLRENTEKAENLSNTSQSEDLKDKGAISESSLEQALTGQSNTNYLSSQSEQFYEIGNSQDSYTKKIMNDDKKYLDPMREYFRRLSQSTSISEGTNSYLVNLVIHCFDYAHCTSLYPTQIYNIIAFIVPGWNNNEIIHQTLLQNPHIFIDAMPKWILKTAFSRRIRHARKDNGMTNKQLIATVLRGVVLTRDQICEKIKITFPHSNSWRKWQGGINRILRSDDCFQILGNGWFITEEDYQIMFTVK